jgi:acyl-CoA synthetase (AMP-forming)/AMP-acid ligase II
VTWRDDLEELRAGWRRNGWHGSEPVGEMIRRAAQRYPGTRYSWDSDAGVREETLHDIYVAGLRLARALRSAGLTELDVVASQLPNSYEATVTICGVLTAGLTLLPMAPGLGPADQRRALAESGARVLVTSASWRGKPASDRLKGVVDGLDIDTYTVGTSPGPGPFKDWGSLSATGTDVKLPQVDADQRALLLYTSGSTATPKAVQHSHNSILVAARGTTIGDMKYRPDYPFFVPSPVSHMAGIMYTLRTLVWAAPMVTVDRWSAERALSLCQRYQPSRMAASTFFFLSLFDYEASIGIAGKWPLTFNTGGATVPPSLIERSNAQGRCGWRSYGSSETPVVTAGNPDEPLHARSHTDGRTNMGAELMIVDDDGRELPGGATGEVLTRGPQMFMGYTDEAMTAEAMAPGGWFRTGDLGRIDHAGYLTIVGRKKDIVIRGGENISTKEVEDVLVTHPLILEAACMSVPDAVYGERMCAVIRPRSSGAVVTLADVRRHFKDSGISIRKTPELVVIYTGEWPRTSYGKVIKPDLLELVIQAGLLVREDGAVRAADR